MNTGAGRPPISREGIVNALDRLRSNRDSISAALLTLDNHPGHRLLDGAELTGVTRDRWHWARDRIRVVWQLFDRYVEVLGRAEALWARDPRPGSADAAELDHLLMGAAVELAGAEIPIENRGLLGPARERELVDFDELLRRMNHAYTEAAEVVATVDAAWTRLLAALGRADEAGRAVGELMSSLRPEPSGSPETSGSPEISGSPELPGLTRSSSGPSGPSGPSWPVGRERGNRDRAHRERATHERNLRELADLGHAVRTDPLSFVREGEADTAPLDRVEAELRGRCGELEAALRIREEYAGRAAALGALVDRVAAARAEAVRARERVLARITSPTLPEMPDPADALRDRLRSLAELHRQGRWLDLAKRTSALEGVAADALDQMSATLGAIMAPLHRRDELRGRLEAYVAKAARLGYAEDGEMSRLHRQARELLWIAPCDLRQAAATVREYQEAIGRRQKMEREPGGP